jgi:hypothetical protein
MVDHPLIISPLLFSEPEMTTVAPLTHDVDVTEGGVINSAESQAYVQFLAKNIEEFLQELLRVVAPL